MQQASCLEGGPLLWIWPLYLHVNKKSDDDNDDDDDDRENAVQLELCFFENPGLSFEPKTKSYLPTLTL